MIEDRIIICFASNWDYDPTSKHHVMKRLAERNHVVWVNYHASRRPRVSSADVGAAAAKLRQFVHGPRRVDRNITVITPLVVPLPGNRAAASLNRHLLTRQIRALLPDLPDWPVQLWSFAPDVDALCGQFDEECVVYYCVDAFSEFSGYNRPATAAAEARLARRADLVVTTSQALYDAKRHLNENTVLVTHGVDYEHFAQATAPDVEVPAEIANLPRPVLGFWGLIQDWLDTALLADVARTRPDWSIVLIGEPATDVSALSALSNVHLLGRRPYATLPRYAAGFDVGLIPFRMNALTLAVNPIKLREYLAAGLPVVSTPLPEVQRYGDLVAVAAHAAGFVRACEQMLKVRPESPVAQASRLCRHRRDGGATKRKVGTADPTRVAIRQAAVRQEGWAAKVEEICRHVERISPRNGSYCPAIDASSIA